MPRLRFFTPLLLCWGLACSDKVVPAKPAPPQATPVPLPLASIEQPAVKVPSNLSWLVIGGGADPMSNQVSLAQDAELVQSMLDGTGLTLFASGKNAQLALDAPVPARPLSLRERLSGLFGLPSAVATQYAPARLPIDGPATREHVLAALHAALTQGREQGREPGKEPGAQPLLVYATCHGERGSAARDNSMSLWGGQSLQVSDLSAALERDDGAAPIRPVRFVITSCYGGGFADLIFREADARRGAASADQCGLFAAPWDDEASGCDPNPDRRAQESYAIHFWHALLGEDRTLRARKSEIDLDADGVIGLLEAHTWARIHAASFDIPTNTSERYLRHVASADSKVRELDPLAAPEEVAVIRALGGRLELDTEQSARDKLAEIDHTMGEITSLVEEAQAAEDDAYQFLRIGLLERFPLLEHPWEERTQSMLAREGKQIMRMLTESTLADAHAAALRDLDELTAQHDGARVERARVLRLVLAFETLRLASSLKMRGGELWQRFQRIRSCERWAPAMRGRKH